MIRRKLARGYNSLFIASAADWIRVARSATCDSEQIDKRGALYTKHQIARGEGETKKRANRSCHPVLRLVEALTALSPAN